MLAVQANGSEIRRRGPRGERRAAPDAEGLPRAHGLQCGFCTPGMMMAAIGIIEADGELTRRRDPPRAGGQPLPLHRLPEHRRRREAGGRRDGEAADGRLERPASGGIGEPSCARRTPPFISRPGPLRRRPRAAGHAPRRVRPLAVRPRDHLRHRHRRGAAMPGVVKIITADDARPRGRRPVRLEPDRHDAPAAASAAGRGPRALPRRAGRDGDRHRPLHGARRRRRRCWSTTTRSRP